MRSEQTHPTNDRRAQVVLLRRKRCIECYREEIAATAGTTLRRVRSSATSLLTPLWESLNGKADVNGQGRAPKCEHCPSRGTTYYDPKGEDGERSFGGEGRRGGFFSFWLVGLLAVDGGGRRVQKVLLLRALGCTGGREGGVLYVEGSWCGPCGRERGQRSARWKSWVFLHTRGQQRRRRQWAVLGKTPLTPDFFPVCHCTTWTRLPL